MTARTPSEAVAAVQRHGTPLTPEQHTAAVALLTDLLATAARHGITPADLDAVVDLPGACVDLAKRRRTNT